jgi:hypothetical protein
MTTCCRPLHENIILKHNIEDMLNISWIQKHEQNIIFIIVNETLLIIDSTKFIKECPRCDREHNLYIYGTWPDVRASFDGRTDLPIRAIVHGIKIFEIQFQLHSEPSFGKFICGKSDLCKIYDSDSYIVYYLSGNIEQPSYIAYQNISVDSRPVVFCQSIDKKLLLIDLDGKILETKTAYSTPYKVDNGILKYEAESESWRYIANSALNTKPAAISE